MTTGYYLIDNPNPYGNHFYPTRRGSVLAIVVHITAGLEDLDAAADNSAEATARYAATTSRKVSWHSGSDTDSAFNLLPASYTAFQVVDYNSRTYGHEISKRNTDWRPGSVSELWVNRTLTQAAVHLGPIARALGVPFRHASKAELDAAIRGGGKPVGFVGHHQLDEDRRDDPGMVDKVGDTFPWARFLNLAAGNPEDDMPYSKEELNLIIRDAVADEMETPGSRTRKAMIGLLKSSIESEAGDLNQALDAWFSKQPPTTG
jgi:hypothetical protein